MDVHGDDVGAGAPGGFEGFLAVEGGAHDLDRGIGIEEVGEELGDGRRIVDDEDSDFFFGAVHKERRMTSRRLLWSKLPLMM